MMKDELERLSGRSIFLTAKSAKVAKFFGFLRDLRELSGKLLSRCRAPDNIQCLQAGFAVNDLGFVGEVDVALQGTVFAGEKSAVGEV